MVPPAQPGDRPWKGSGGRAKRRRKYGARWQKRSWACESPARPRKRTSPPLCRLWPPISPPSPDPILAARLISRAGGLSRLAKMPSSRVQVMGAEKSLFKHLKGQAPSPKHGIIFRHPAVIGSAKKLRGRVARTLAAKLAIAARLDHFGAGLSLDLQASLDARLRDIKQRGRNKGR